MAIDRYYKQSKADINKPVREGMMSKIDTEAQKEEGSGKIRSKRR